ncbi:phage head-tail connector protein [Edaphobacillus lindanitolerans]|uniref:Phage gp6-like head-tail connector protein n=1 Tax=Edaphobacillus lindanitolerans TaxID=550447 RepID=A0A1U7PSS5_9BACI|nr:phage head-tail connector protein [Edaphobacillus lindanitolerans]SIT91687.1 Phage gp6-like head-tail connector protein [Edaphobacillus lindanitolerans]
MEDLEKRILGRVKRLIGLSDALQDEALQEIIQIRREHLQIELERDEIPSALEFILVELSVRRYNRIGSEGMRGESVEGHSVNFYDLAEEFKPYDHLINRYRPKDQTQPGRGKAIFL